MAHEADALAAQSEPSGPPGAVDRPQGAAAPRASVVIPSYNCGRYVLEAVESARSQTLPPFEIIVVDDGSTDDTRQVLESAIADGTIRYVWQANQGPGAARNAGIAVARGNYIAFLDADDVLLPTSLEERVEVVRRWPHTVMVFGNYYLEGIEGQRTVSLRRNELLHHARPACVADHRALFEGDFREICGIGREVWTGAVLVKRAVFDRVGLFRTDTRLFEDRDMWLRIIAEGAVAYVDLPLTVYKRYRGTLTEACMGNRSEHANASIMVYGPVWSRHRRDRKVRRFSGERLGWAYYDRARHHADSGRRARAFIDLLRSVRYDCRNRLSWHALGLLFVPRGFVRLARSLIRRRALR